MESFTWRTGNARFHVVRMTSKKLAEMSNEPIDVPLFLRLFLYALI